MDIFTRLGADNVARILAALTASMDIKVESPKNVNVESQKWYICRYIDNLSHEARVAVGDLIKLNGKGDEIKECNSGLIIKLDNIPDYIISQIYLFVIYKNGALA